MTRILITGVRGKTGLPLARSLAARADVEVRGGSSDPASVALDGVVATGFSWDDPAGWAPAAEAVDAAYVVRPDRPDAPELVAAFLEVLPAPARVVLLSERDSDSFGPDGWSERVERAVRESGHPWTAVRPSWFMDVLSDPRFFRDEVARGRLPFAARGGVVAWIDARDIAAVVEEALLGEGHDGQAYELTGPASLSLPATAAVLAEALGRPVEHVEVSLEEALEGATGFDRDEYAWTLDRVRDGVFAPVTDTVEQVTGRAPRSLAQFAADHAGEWSAT
jgi:uncharacterized protein YbjT (DUF2867 family)